MIILQSIIDGILDIRDHFGRTLLELVGIALGAASIVATFALSAGGKAEAMESYRVSGGIERIVIANKPFGKVNPGARALASHGMTYRDSLAIQRDAREIDLVSPVATSSMNIRYRSIEKNRLVLGVSPAYAPMTDFHAGTGRFITDRDLASAARVVVLGSMRPRELFGSENPLGKTITMNGTGYEVVGVMQEKYYVIGHQYYPLRSMNRMIFIPFTTLVTRQGQTLKNGKVSFMYARMRDVKRADQAVGEIEKILLREHGVVDYQVFSRVANLKRDDQNNRMYNVTYMICGIISLLVGGIVVMNIQLASFNERLREVGTRKAIGATGLQIFSQFMAESILVATLGGFLGLFVGRVFSEAISRLTDNPTIITADTLIWALLFAAGTGLIFGIYPAVRASRLNPIEALRAE